MESYSNYVFINRTQEDVFDAITNKIDKWWTDKSKGAVNVGEILKVEFEKGTFWEMEVIGYSPPSYLEWKVLKAFHNLENLSRKDEWMNTTIIWEITEIGDKIKAALIHKGLIPSLQCYDICQNGWNYFLESLKKYLEEGEGNPFKIK